MVSVGDEFVNAQSGERFVWRATAQSTSGEYCEFDLYLSAGAQVSALHVHPRQTESFTVLAGALALRRGSERRLLAAGADESVPPGVTHGWSNSAPLPAEVRVRLTPALRIEDFFERFCAIASSGGATSSGIPRNPLRLALLLDDFRAEWGFPSRWQRALLPPVLSLLARAARAARVSPAGTGRQGSMSTESSDIRRAADD